jgi:hypothetical protein
MVDYITEMAWLLVIRKLCPLAILHIHMYRKHSRILMRTQTTITRVLLARLITLMKLDVEILFLVDRRNPTTSFLVA